MTNDPVKIQVGSQWKIKERPDLAPFQRGIRYRVTMAKNGWVTFRVIMDDPSVIMENSWKEEKFLRFLAPVEEVVDEHIS